MLGFDFSYHGNHDALVAEAFPADAVIAGNSYLVVGESAAPPQELPNGIPYVNLGAVGGGNIPFGSS